jgi:hypothetical protein
MTVEDDLRAELMARHEATSASAFGAEPPEVVKQVQTFLNSQGWQPALSVDGATGPKTDAAVIWWQQNHGLSADGIIGPQTLGSMGIVAKTSSGASTGPKVSISTTVRALKLAAAEKGHALEDRLASLMIGQLRGAEGAYPGVGGTLGGTNNMGAAQVTKSLASAKQGLKGWGAFAHYDSSPNSGGYIGWYWIAPSPLEAARYWLSNWWGNDLLSQNPQDPTTYASILYRKGYFEGMHPGDTNKDPNSEAGQLNVADYARAIARGVATATEMSQPFDDPEKLTVNPAQFKSLTERKITQSLYEKDRGGSWSWLFPASWDDFVKTNGAVWFGPAPGIAGAIVLGIGAWLTGGVVFIAGLLGYRYYKEHY